MATFVLIHPAWLGGWSWGKVRPLLQARGHDVWAPTLTGLGERTHLARRDVGLETHIEDVVRVLECEGLERVVLVGNSSSGAVITGVADRVPERIACLVYLDAFAPQDGQSVFDLIAPERRAAMQELVATEGEGWLLPRFAQPPWSAFVPKAWAIVDETDLAWMLARLRPTPFRHFTDPLRLARGDTRVPRVYVRCLAWPHPLFDRFAEAARNTKGWRCQTLEAPHLPYITHPDLLVERLKEVALDTGER